MHFFGLIAYQFHTPPPHVLLRPSQLAKIARSSGWFRGDPETGCRKMMMQGGFAAFGGASSSQAPLPQEAWQLKPRQASKRKHDGCDLSPPSEGDDFSPDSTTASSLMTSKASQEATPNTVTTTTTSTMLSPFLGGMSMSMDVTPGSRMTDRMSSRGMSSVPPPPVACNFQRRQGKSASFAPLAPGVQNRTTGLLSGLPVAAVPRNRGGSMMSD